MIAHNVSKTTVPERLRMLFYEYSYPSFRSMSSNGVYICSGSMWLAFSYKHVSKMP